MREKNAAISPAVERVVLTALAKESVQRFGSVEDFALALAHVSQTTTFSSFSSGQRKADLPHRQFIVPTTAVELVVSPTQCAETTASGDHATGSAAPKSLRRVRRTALIKHVCLSLLLVTVLFWLLTAANPTFHSVFALAILFALTLWIAAYADHRRAAERLHQGESGSRFQE